MENSSNYNPKGPEEKWYQHWMDQGYFHSEPDEREAYSIVIPPPNVTGILHMGHILNNTIQDILIRKARMDGKNACWVPGTDHASIATEAKVVRMLREKGIKKSDLTREEFLAHAWEWTDKYGGIILSQLKKLGASCDWERTAFTFDETRSKSVIKVFIDLYKKGKIYRGLRMVNWDPKAKTVLSNEEVLYKAENSKLYSVRYQIEGTEEYITIATTRPETILGDSAIAVNPKDERYTHLEGKRAIVPKVNRSIPIIFDSYVDVEFGTGALKVTPAHDVNDYDIGLRHDLEVIDVLNDDGTMSEVGGFYIGESRFEARKLIVKDLEEAGHIVEIENYTHEVGRSERTNAVIEPKLSLQWYVDMKEIAKPALDAVMTDEVSFFPKGEKNKYRRWMENIRDWCISRQLWWGHRIPAYFLGEDVFVAESPEAALAQAIEKTGNADLTIADLNQDEDVLDTWFSSWLWPITVFDGFEKKKDFEYYYPTDVVVTGWDIINLWIARMIMSGYEWKNERPFKAVYFTGMVRDKKGRKMSKSLGNSPDALGLIDQFGADGVRFGIMSSSPAGGDLLFDDALCGQGSKFCNKIWNAKNLVKRWTVDAAKPQSDLDKLSVEWFDQLLKSKIKNLESSFASYRLSEALMDLYKFVWGDFCSYYLEMIKPGDGKVDPVTYDATLSFFDQICTALHPFMPFITEEIWHQLKDREGKDCIMSAYPKVVDFDKKIIEDVAIGHDIISKIRDVRNKNSIKNAEALDFAIQDSEKAQAFLSRAGMKEMIMKISNLKSLEIIPEAPDKVVAFNSDVLSCFVLIEQEIDVEAETAKLKEELSHQEKFILGIQKKLSNERFVNNAPAAVVDKERKKMADGEARIANIKEQLAKLN